MRIYIIYLGGIKLYLLRYTLIGIVHVKNNKKITTWSERYQILIGKWLQQTKSIPLTHPVYGGVRVAHLFSFLCCVFGEVRVAHLLSFLCCVFGEVRVAPLFSFLFCFLVGPVLLIFLVFCVVFFGGVRVAHLFSFLCCVFW